MKRKALGRGLSALLSDVSIESIPQKTIQEVEIDQIEMNEYQPRSFFDSDSLNELAESIRNQGILQPLLVRNHPSIPDYFQLIAGERRLRASKIAGLTKVPCLILQAEDTRLLEIALVENIQRSNLSSVDEAKAFKQLMERFSLTQEEVSAKVGKSRESIANSLRLLNLPENILELLHQGIISTGHAKCLLSLKNKEEINKYAKIIEEQQLSVRETEKLLKEGIQQQPKAENKPKKAQTKDIHLADLESKLEDSFQTKVNIKMRGKKKGTIEIQFFDYDHLESLLKRWNVHYS